MQGHAGVAGLQLNVLGQRVLVHHARLPGHHAVVANRAASSHPLSATKAAQERIRFNRWRGILTWLKHIFRCLWHKALL
jgi:hypothetical protein